MDVAHSPQASPCSVEKVQQITIRPQTNKPAKQIPLTKTQKRTDHKTHCSVGLAVSKNSDGLRHVALRHPAVGEEHASPGGRGIQAVLPPVGLALCGNMWGYGAGERRGGQGKRPPCSARLVAPQKSKTMCNPTLLFVCRFLHSDSQKGFCYVLKNVSKI